jgi:arsenate reductase-like glutaredoxin family protein
MTKLRSYGPVLVPDNGKRMFVPPEDQHKMIDLYKQIGSSDRVAKMLFYSSATVIKVMKMNEVPLTPAGAPPGHLLYPLVRNPNSKRKTFLPPDEQEKVIQDYERIGSSTKVAKKHGIGKETVTRLLKLSGLYVHPAHGRKGVIKSTARDKGKIQDIGDMYLDGYSKMDIARIYNMCETTVSYYLEDAGVPLRTRQQGYEVAYLRCDKTRRMLELLEAQKEPISTIDVKTQLDIGKQAAIDRLTQLAEYGLVERVGKHVNRYTWVRTNKSVTEVIAKIAPNPHLVSRPAPELPSAPVARFIDFLIEREGRKRFMQGDTTTAHVHHTQSPTVLVCGNVGIDDRTLRRWRRGVATNAQWDQVDKILTKSPYAWWDVFTEKTVRKPELTIEIKSWVKKENARGTYWSREPIRTILIGDKGPDYEELERIRSIMTVEDRALAA